MARALLAGPVHSRAGRPKEKDLRMIGKFMRSREVSAGFKGPLDSHICNWADQGNVDAILGIMEKKLALELSAGAGVSKPVHGPFFKSLHARPFLLEVQDRPTLMGMRVVAVVGVILLRHSMKLCGWVEFSVVGAVNDKFPH